MSENAEETEAPAAAPKGETLIKVEPMGDKPPLLTRINPLKFFRRESPEMFVKDGLNLIENQNLAQATVAFQRALAIDPNFSDAFKGLGNVFFRKGGRSNLAIALENYQAALARDPFQEQIYALTAKIYEKIGKMKEATMERKKMVIVRTLQTDARNPVANNNMGILLLQQKQTETAITYFKRAIATNPGYDVAYRNLAATYYRGASGEDSEDKKEENIGLAKGNILKALEILETLSSLLVHGKILMLEERLEEALAVAERAEALDQTHKDVYALKRMVLERLNRTKDAQEAFDSYQRLHGQT